MTERSLDGKTAILSYFYKHIPNDVDTHTYLLKNVIN